jgi:glycosyltransferase involved in cell wall biosynthesis
LLTDATATTDNSLQSAPPRPGEVGPRVPTGTGRRPDAHDPPSPPPIGDDKPLRILIACDSASLRFGGEAALPLHYFRFMLREGIYVRLVVHERCREELTHFFPDSQDRIDYTDDTRLDRIIWRCRKAVPGRLGHFTFGLMLRLKTQFKQRKRVIQSVKQHRIDVVHQPTPVSPREPSALYGLGVPLVIGPMNGGMDYPEPFRQMQSRMVDFGMWSGRLFSNLLNRVVRGKREAQTLLVANQRTNLALPSCLRGEVHELVENGVDLNVWQCPERPADAYDADRPTRFAYLGRLVDWKAVNLLLEAFGRVVNQAPAVLEIIGDGEDRKALEAQAEALDLPDDCAVRFTGWLSQEECAARLGKADALVLSSLLECGGAVVLEAMAIGLPVVASRWGGPVDYLDKTCGYLIEPSSRLDFIQGLTDAMLRLAKSPELRRQMGDAGREKVVRQFDWDTKGRHMLEVYRDSYRHYHQRTQAEV